MKQLDWYNDSDIYLLARLEAGRFLSCDSGDLEKRHFNILKDYYYDLWVNDFDQFRQAAEDFGYEAVRIDDED